MGFALIVLGTLHLGRGSEAYNLGDATVAKRMTATAQNLNRELLSVSRLELTKRLAPTIVRCLRRLDDKEIWWRPNAASNSVGNLVLHLSGNVRQWVISGLAGAPDYRQRDREFAETGGIPRAVLVQLITQTANAAAAVFERLTPVDLLREYSIQGYSVTGIYVVLHVVTHFSQHAGQIIAIAKSCGGRDLGFTHLPRARRPVPPPPGAEVHLVPDGPMWPWLDSRRVTTGR